MHATKPTRFVVEYEDADKHERLMARAIERGTYQEDCDDWFDPGEVASSKDAGESLAAARRLARRLARDSLYGQARIVERVGIEEVGMFWDYESTREIELVVA